MPTYEYQCPVCGKVREEVVPIQRRDDVGLFCRHDGMLTFMPRKTSAPSFTVKGFNARNGYTTTPDH